MVGHWVFFYDQQEALATPRRIGVAQLESSDTKDDMASGSLIAG